NFGNISKPFSPDTFDWSEVRKIVFSTILNADDFETTLTRDIPFNVVSIPTEWDLHATAIIVVKIKKNDTNEVYLLKANRGYKDEDKPGLRFYKVGAPEKLVTTLKSGIEKMKTDKGEFFLKEIDEQLLLTEMHENYIVHKEQTIGNC